MSHVTEANYSKENTRNKIISTLTNMLKRNLESDGINPRSEMELWRRPLYFTKNAFPIVNKSGSDNVGKELARQIKCFGKDDAAITEFCITDEGYTFIEKIATNFEFYSVRYNGNTAIPLCCLTDIKEIDDRINRVYVQVRNCICKHQWLMDFTFKTMERAKIIHLAKIIKMMSILIFLNYFILVLTKTNRNCILSEQYMITYIISMIIVIT